MGKIILARHGESEDNSLGILAGIRDTRLTPRGYLHGYNLARNIHLSGEFNISRIVSSPLHRARKTAETCASHLSHLYMREMQVHTMDILIERNFGKLEGCLVSEIEVKARSFRHVYDGKIVYVEEADEAEVMEAFYDRANEALDELKQLTSEDRGDTLVVSHAGISQMIYLRHHKRHWEDIFKIPPMDNGEWLAIE